MRKIGNFVGLALLVAYLGCGGGEGGGAAPDALADAVVDALAVADGGADAGGAADVGGDSGGADAVADVVEWPAVVALDDGHVAVTVDRLAGTFDIAVDGFVYVRGAASAVETGVVGVLETRTTTHLTAGAAAAPRPFQAAEEEGGALVARLEHPDFALGPAATVFRWLPGGGGLTVQLEVDSAGIPELAALLPLVVDTSLDCAPAGAGLFLRSAPADLLVLQNGSDQGLDYYVDLVPGDTRYRRGMLDTITTGLPSAASNWNALVFDRAHGESLSLGYLSFERVIPTVEIGWHPDRAPEGDAGPGFYRLAARNAYLFARAESAGRRLRSEVFWLDRSEGRPHVALERWAQLVAERYPPPAPKPPQAGWDSWYVYGEELTEDLIHENLAGLVAAFGDYGLSSLEVDLGWEMQWGSWRAEPPGFPSGMADLADRIRAEGLMPELWMSSFNAMLDSTVATAHPDWIAPTPPLFLALAQPNARPLDVSRQDVRDFVAETGQRMAGWGYDSTKFDFAYYTLFSTALADPDHSVISAYRAALQSYVEGTGRDRYLINILLMGTNAGLVDAMRIGIDTWPCWGDDPDESCPEAQGPTTGYSGMGLRYAVRTLARRYYLNNVLFVNHPDQVFYRDHLGLEAQRAWATLVALSGAYLSLGDAVATLSEEEVDTHRRLLPNLGVTGVPQDLFEREYPEVWLTPLAGRGPGGAALGLYNWGTNLDWTESPPRPLAEEPRHHAVALADLGLAGPHHAFEFWTATDLGVIAAGGAVTLDVPPRDCRVVVLRPAADHPYVVASNRHVSQGATDLTDPVWDPAANTLTWEQDLVVGFPHVVRLAAEPFAHLPTVTAGSAAVTVSEDGALVAVSLTPAETGRVTVRAEF